MPAGSSDVAGELFDATAAVRRASLVGLNGTEALDVGAAWLGLIAIAVDGLATAGASRGAAIVLGAGATGARGVAIDGADGLPDCPTAASDPAAAISGAEASAAVPIG